MKVEYPPHRRRNRGPDQRAQAARIRLSKQAAIEAKAGDKERELDITGVTGSEFRLILRQSLFNILDSSAILAYSGKSSSQVFRLRRYNGKSHEHTNKIERQTIYDFHIHFATERYQHSGLREDAYAEATNRSR